MPAVAPARRHALSAPAPPSAVSGVACASSGLHSDLLHCIACLLCRYVCADTFRNLTRGFEEVPKKDLDQPEGAAAAAGAGATA